MSTLAGPAFDAIDPGGYVVSYPIARVNAVALHANLADQRGNAGFEFSVTGGDRFVAEDGSHRSSTNGGVVAGSDARSPHLEERGARAVDLRIRGVSDSRVDDAVKKTQFLPENTRRGYPDRHTHVALPNQPRFNRPDQ